MEYWRFFGGFCKFSEYRVINMLVSYFILCILLAAAILVLKLVIRILAWCIEKGLDTINKFVFGKKHQKSLKYNSLIL